MPGWSVQTIEGTIPKVLRSFGEVKGIHGGSPIAVVYGEKPEGGLTMIVVVLEGIEKDEMPAMVRTAAVSAGGKYALLVAESFVMEHDEDVGAWLASGRSIGEHPKARTVYFAALEGGGVHRAYMWDGKSEGIEGLPGQNVEGLFYNFSGLLGQN